MNGERTGDFTYHWVVLAIVLIVIGCRQLGLRDQSSPLLTDGRGNLDGLVGKLSISSPYLFMVTFLAWLTPRSLLVGWGMESGTQPFGGLAGHIGSI